MRMEARVAAARSSSSTSQTASPRCSRAASCAARRDTGMSRAGHLLPASRDTGHAVEAAIEREYGGLRFALGVCHAERVHEIQVCVLDV